MALSSCKLKDTECSLQKIAGLLLALDIQKQLPLDIQQVHETIIQIRLCHNTKVKVKHRDTDPKPQQFQNRDTKLQVPLIQPHGASLLIFRLSCSVQLFSAPQMLEKLNQLNQYAIALQQHPKITVFLLIHNLESVWIRTKTHKTKLKTLKFFLNSEFYQCLFANDQCKTDCLIIAFLKQNR